MFEPRNECRSARAIGEHPPDHLGRGLDEDRGTDVLRMLREIDTHDDFSGRKSRGDIRRIEPGRGLGGDHLG